MDDAPRSKLRSGDPAIIPLEDWNRVRAEMLRLLALGAVPPMVWSWQGGRRVLVDTTPPGLWAQLSGSTSPYTGTQKVRDPATLAWVDGPLSLTNIIEVNGGSGLGGTVQRVEPGAPGEWLFQSVRLGALAGPTINCLPCTLNQTTYSVTWTYAKRGGGTSSTTQTLTHKGGTLQVWSTPVFTLPDFGGLPAGTTTYHQIEFGCWNFTQFMETGLFFGTSGQLCIFHRYGNTSPMTAANSVYVFKQPVNPYDCTTQHFEFTVTNTSELIGYAADVSFVVDP